MAGRVTATQYYNLTGQLNNILRQIRQSEGYPFDPVNLQAHLQAAIAGRFGESSVSSSSRSWHEEDGVIYFTVITDGTTGEDWIDRLVGSGFRVEQFAKQVLCSPDFKPTNGVTTQVAVLRGTLFGGNDQIKNSCIRAEGDRRNLAKPDAELACYIRMKFTDKEIEAMGLTHLVTMHKPVEGDLLSAHRFGDGCCLDAYTGEPTFGWGGGDGFAFVVSQAQGSSGS